MSHPHSISPGIPADPRLSDVPEPDELRDAAPCPCGGHAIMLPKLGRWDSASLVCSNRPRCSRCHSYSTRALAAAVSDWNLEIAEEKES